MKSVEERFWEKVRKLPGKDACWIWTGGRWSTESNGGYGCFWFEGKMVSSHKFSFEKHAKRRVRKGKLVCHTCDNPVCVRPNHLFEGSYKDNAQDARNKGRIPVGSEHGAAKLTEDKVRRILREYVWYKITQKMLAAKYKVSQRTVFDVVHRNLWRHVKLSLRDLK